MGGWGRLDQTVSAYPTYKHEAGLSLALGQSQDGARQKKDSLGSGIDFFCAPIQDFNYLARIPDEIVPSLFN